MTIDLIVRCAMCCAEKRIEIETDQKGIPSIEGALLDAPKPGLEWCFDLYALMNALCNQWVKTQEAANGR